MTTLLLSGPAWAGEPQPADRGWGFAVRTQAGGEIGSLEARDGGSHATAVSALQAK